MNYVVEPVMGVINTGLNTWLGSMGGSSKIALGFILGGMMAIDMEVHSIKQPMYLV